MKKVLTALILIVCIRGLYAQPPAKDTPIIYTEVVAADSLSHESLIKNAKRFFALTYKSANDVIQLSEADEIIGKGNFPLTYFGALTAWDVRIEHTVSIVVKDGRYKYEVRDLRVIHPSGAMASSGPIEQYNTGRKLHKRFLSDVDREVKKIIAALKLQMAEQKESW